MRQTALLTAVILFTAFQSDAQVRPAPRPQLLARPSSAVETQAVTAQTIRVLALMAEFQQDADPLTTGDGRFLTSGSALQIDPPPHDSAYFASKLRFLENYFFRVSNGQVQVQAELFPVPITLPDSMATYSPQGEDDLDRLAGLIIDGWTAADAASPGFPFSSYDAFIVFHAGAGRDVDLGSLLGFDPTPHDIPSVTLNLSTLRTYLKNPSYPGVPVNGDTVHITNTMVLPETESRLLNLGGFVDTLQLGINGLLAASFGSTLGLPDLFDTRTGRSGIGQFGLMDGAGIFAYNGVLPPEPSAWEKIRLGWTTPVTLSSSATVPLPAVGSIHVGSDTVYKIPISSTEYFLIENRSRDPEGNGQTLTLVRGGQTVILHFGGDTTGFAFNDVSAIYGSLVDAEDFDWALPGSTLVPGYEGGGMLVWHIDETDLADKIATNTVNADPTRRTVDLEEADGSQDIGVRYDLFDPGSGTEYGWPPDFWFAGNPSPVYANAFGPATFPDSRANSGSPSLVTISGFGPRAVRTNMTVTLGNTLIQRAWRFDPTVGSGVQFAVTDSGVYYAGAGGAGAKTIGGVSRAPDSAGVISTENGTGRLAVREGSATVLVTAADSAVTVRTMLDTNGDGVLDSVDAVSLPLGQPVTAGPVIADSAGIPHAFVGTGAGNLAVIRLDAPAFHMQSWAADSILDLIAFPSPGAPALVALTKSGLTNGSTSLSMNVADGTVHGIRLGSADFLVVRESATALVIAGASLTESPVRIDLTSLPSAAAAGPIRFVVPGDLDRDGVLDVIIAAGRFLLAVNARGAPLDGFPVDLQHLIATEPLVTDLNGDGRSDVVVCTEDGALRALTGDGRVLEELRIQAAGPDPTDMAVVRTPSGEVRLLVASGDGSMEAWDVARPFANLQGEWLQRRGGASKAGVSVVSTTGAAPKSGEFLPADRVYNWPNPVYGASTRIRYFTAEPAEVSVRILTLGGDTVTELHGRSSGGADEELSWDVTGIDSGIYFARIEASGNGKREAVVIKIAVVK